MYFLYHPQYKDNVADQARLASAKAAQRAIVNFVGASSELSSALNYIGTKLMSSIYTTGGQGALHALGKADDLVTTAGLSSLKDPVAFMRNVAFNSKLGFFNPVQLFVQMQSMAHSLAVSPLHGGQGMAAAVLSRYLVHNPEQIDTLARVASKLGWKSENFKEMFDAMRTSGIYQVAGEAALRDDVFDPKLFRSTAGWMLDKGAMFFNEGERLVRLTSFATAYHEWRAANKTAELTNRVMGELMNRSDLLSVNMTRASSAAWQSGALAVPTQFFAFNARIAEQFLGSRLTGAEKARALAVYSGLYGMPVAAGIVTLGTSPIPGIPTSYEDIKQEAFKRGIDLSPKYLEIMTEGLLSVGMHMATGREYNVASRLGPGASTTFSNLFRNDKSWLDIGLGASGTILQDIWKTTYPFQHAVASVFTDNGDYPVKGSDWMSLARNISTVDLGAKAWGAASYGKWYTKNGTQVGEADGFDAVMAAFGLTPQPVANTFLKVNALEGQQDAQKIYEKDAMQNFRLGMQAGAAGNYNSMQEYFTRARTSMKAGDFQFIEQNRIFQQAIQQNQDLERKINWDLVRKSPASQLPARLDQFFKSR
jgi:hypothetical protein